MACNSAVLRPTKEYLPPSCSSRDSASDESFYYANMAAITCKTANDFKTSSNPVL